MFLFLVLVLLAGLAIRYSVKTAVEGAENRLRLSAAETLNQQAGALLSHLEKYRYLPAVLAQSREVMNTARGGSKLPQDPELKRRLEAMTLLSGSLDIAVVAPDGRILSSVNNLISSQLASQPDLVKTVYQGRLGRLATSMPNGIRAYAYGTAIRFERELLGMVIVLASLEFAETAWALSGKPVFATNDRNQIVARDLQVLELSPGNFVPSLSELSRSRDGSVTILSDEPYQIFSKPIHPLGWNLHVLESRDSVEQASSQAALISVLGSALSIMAIMVLVNRWLRQARAERQKRANAIRLERRVRERTHELFEANEQLRKAQAELVQAAKLAGLGQMSAALSHEFNQPLAAIRSYADNAVRYIERGRSQEATANIKRVSALTERMASLSKDLQNFSRRPQERTTRVELQSVVASALELLGGRIAEAAITIENCLPQEPIHVDAGVNRLQQVVVNLIVNAMDIIRQEGIDHEPAIIISCERSEGRSTLKVRDFGPGFTPDIAEKMFDPFFTTKGVNEGLGLGLSISYNIIKDFEGQLSARNHPDGGAEFSIELKDWDLEHHRQDTSQEAIAAQ